MKVFNIVFGVLSIIVGAICLMHPFASQLMYAYIIAIFIGAMGIMSLISWFLTRNERKQGGQLAAVTGTAMLVVGILCVVFMLLNITLPFFTYSLQEFAAIVVALFMLIEGIGSVISAITNSNNESTGARIINGVLGVIMIGVFAYALLFPASIIAMFGIFLGMGMFIQGFNRIAFALTL